MKDKRTFSSILVPAPATATSSPAADSGSAERVPWASSNLLTQASGRPGQGDDETVRVRRRRRTTPPGPEGRERAEAPRRRRPGGEGPAAPPPGGTGGMGGVPRPPTPRPVSSGVPLPGGMRLSPLLAIGLLVLLALCAVPVMLLLGPRDGGEEVYIPPTSTPRPALPDVPTATPRPFTPPPAAAEGQTWLVMLYQDADDKILEQDIYVDLNEAERVGSSDRVHVVAQVDRFSAGYTGDGDWTTARRFYVTQDDDLQRVRSQLVADLGEVNMSDGSTLVDFVTWAVETFPADRHALILSDHGMGWPGGWTDPAPGGRGDPDIPLASALGDQLYLMELDQALGEVRARSGLQQIELIGMDACLMGHLEVLSALAPHARYAVLSQETEPALGWAYASFLQALQENPDMGGAELGRRIVESYIQDDQRIVDDQARADMLRQGSPLGGLFGSFGGATAEQVAQQMGQNATLTLIDLAALPGLMDSVNDLSFALQGASQPAVARARTYAQSFTSVFGSQVPPSYIDLGHLAQLLKREGIGGDAAQAADRLLAALGQAVIAEKHGPGKPGATGVSIYFPNSQLYGSPVTGPQSYTAVARRFAEESLWDDFLAYHYAGRAFEPAAGAIAVPGPGVAVRGPGAGAIEVAPIALSDRLAAPGRPVLLSTQIRGQNIGHVYLLVGFYDQESNAIWMADTDYLESADTREVGGVYYPLWPQDGTFTMEFEWEPLVFAIYDGVDSVLALFTPQTYGALPEQATYTVEGIYTYADGGESRYARLYFRDGTLRQAFGFTGQGGTGAPREIIPQPGDTFTVLQKWLDLDAQGKVAQVATQEGGTLTFGDQMFTWQELDAAPGAYVVGFIVQDLDGNAYEVYERVTVE